MTVYVDVLLVINYIVNMLLLSCYSKFAGRRLKRWRIVAAALLGAFGSLSIFLPSLGFLFELVYKLVLSAAMILLAAKPESPGRFFMDWLLFFITGFLFAGAMLALWMFVRPGGMLYYNGIVYFNISAAGLLMATATAYFIGGIFWRISKKGRIPQQKYNLTLQLGERKATVQAVVDTGNNLYEPFSGSPVVICSMQSLLPLFSAEVADAISSLNFEYAAKLGINFRFIPYKVVGGGGMLPAFRPEKALLEQGSVLAVDDLYIAISVAGMQDGALLHPDLAVMMSSTEPETAGAKQ